MAKKIQLDAQIRSNLHGIIHDFPRVMDKTVEVNKDRNILVDDLCALIARLPMNTEQVKKLYVAITNRMDSRVCFRCARSKPTLGGGYVYPENDMSKPTRFVCKECNV